MSYTLVETVGGFSIIYQKDGRVYKEQNCRVGITLFFSAIWREWTKDHLRAGIWGSNSTNSANFSYELDVSILISINIDKRRSEDERRRIFKNVVILACRKHFKAQNYPRYYYPRYPRVHYQKKTERKGAVLVRVPEKTSSHSHFSDLQHMPDGLLGIKPSIFQ